MSTRRGTFLFTGLATAVLAAVLLLTREDSADEPVVIDERRGTVAGVRFGATADDVRALLGEPTDDKPGFFPAGTPYTGPPGIPTPPGRTEELHYAELAFLVSSASGVYSIAVLADGARTQAGVSVGEPLDRVRAGYRRVACGEARAGEALVGPDPSYEWCRAVVDDVRVFFGGDPIASITRTRDG